MNLMTTIGAGLVALALIVVLLGNLSYTETKPLLRAGPIQIDTQVEHRMATPTIAGIVILIAGIGLIAVGRRA